MVVSDRVFAKLLGKELRRAREAGGWTRAQFVERLPCGIADRTLLSYEHGIRSFNVPRFYEICRALGVSASEVLRRTEVAAADLTGRTLTVNLRAVRGAVDGHEGVAEWAHRRLLSGTGGTVRLEPATVREMAASLGFEHEALAEHLAEFSVDDGGR